MRTRRVIVFVMGLGSGCVGAPPSPPVTSETTTDVSGPEPATVTSLTDDTTGELTTGELTTADGEGSSTGVDPGVSCGNGIAEKGEECDGTDLRGSACGDEGFYGGTLSCTASCSFDTTQCHLCGNDSIDPGEECDGILPKTASCSELGYDEGKLGCTADCLLDASGCTYSCDACVTMSCADELASCNADEVENCPCCWATALEQVCQCSPLVYCEARIGTLETLALCAQAMCGTECGLDMCNIEGFGCTVPQAFCL